MACAGARARVGTVLGHGGMGWDGVGNLWTNCRWCWGMRRFNGNYAGTKAG